MIWLQNLRIARSSLLLLACKMSAHLSRVHNFEESLFDLPVERIIAWCRFFLSVISLIAALITKEEMNFTFLDFVIGFYAATSIIWLATLLRRRERRYETYLVHAGDISVSSLLMYLTAGSTSPFFVFFTFTLLGATLRWNWRGALATCFILTGALGCLYFAHTIAGANLIDEAADLRRTIIRGGFLLVCGLMLAYVGAYRERVRDRFAQLAAWPPSVEAEETQPLAKSLAHTSKVMRASHSLAIWDERDEPCRHIALWAAGEFRYSRERADTFAQLVNPSQQSNTFVIAGARRGEDSVARPLDRALQRTFGISSAVTAPFWARDITGRVFVFNRDQWNDEDIALAEIVAKRLGNELQENALRSKVRSGAAAQERMRLGRDLHDGLLQSLAAASLHLKAVAMAAGSESIQQQLVELRHILADEARRVRTFVEDSRLAEPTTGLVPVAAELAKRIERLRQQWDCSITMEIHPPDLVTSLSTSRAIRHMVSEAVSNAVRHGRASQVEIILSLEHERLRVVIHDNGNGFDNLISSGLAEVAEAPLSLRSRVEELGGVLYLSSSAQGAEITLDLPR